MPRVWDDEITEESHSTASLSIRGPRRPRLTMMTGASAGEMLSLDDRDEFIIGRSQTTDFAVDDPGVSRRHCRILRQNGRLYIEDLGATNGTLVNGVRVGKAALSDGDRIQIGPKACLQLRFVDDVEDTLSRRMLEASTRDVLTGVYNRRHFHSRLEAELSYAKRHGTGLACIVLDLDYFKAVNDTFGHAAGDAVLRAVGGAISRCVRTEDLAARYGGEEFVLLARVESLEEARLFAERIRACINALRIVIPGKGPIRVTVSAGVAEVWECGGESGMALVGLADKRLYCAKHRGRDQVCSAI
jgi:diguanylate cyclase (GGDEF)-like protein